ncbi:hypothetical protein BT69DRAFT_1280380 [Atractiella rhizophila]|nr:hypothetical protein BT69DRAFT_1280380 [Atractiella rhizophila]
MDSSLHNHAGLVQVFEWLPGKWGYLAHFEERFPIYKERMRRVIAIWKYWGFISARHTVDLEDYERETDRLKFSRHSCTPTPDSADGLSPVPSSPSLADFEDTLFS